MIKTGDFTIYYGGKRKPFIFLFSKTSVQMAVFDYTESTLQINHHGPQSWSRYKVMWEGHGPRLMLLSELGQVP